MTDIDGMLVEISLIVIMQSPLLRLCAFGEDNNKKICLNG